MSLHGWGIRDEDGAATSGAAWSNHSPRPARPPWPATTSSKTKRNAAGPDRLDPQGQRAHRHADPAGERRPVRPQAARPVHVFVTKDRPGFLRQQGRPDRKIPGKTFMGELVVDDTRTYVGHLELKLWAPKDDADGEVDQPTPQRDTDEAEVLTVVTRIIDSGLTPNVRAVRAGTTFGKDRTDYAIERLLQRHALTETPGPNRSRIFGVAEDHSSDDTDGTP